MEIFDFIAVLSPLLAASWRLATPLIYASLGEVFCERSGLVNIGMEGIMLLGAFTAFAITFFSGNLLLGLLGALVAGVVSGLLFGFFTLTLKANQIVVGAALNLVGAGLTSFLFRALFIGKLESTRMFASFSPLPVPFLHRLPFFGEILFNQNGMVYGTVLLIPITAFLLYRTAFGLSLRAVGENPEAVEAAGLSVNRFRYSGVIIGAVMAALGGAYLTIAHTSQFVEGITSGRGFIALAIVVIGRWKPLGAFCVSLLFGFFFALQLRLQSSQGLIIPYQLLQALPYVMTILIFVVLPRKTKPPEALGIPYNPSH